MKEFIKKQCVKIALYIGVLIVLSFIGYIFEINVSILANISSVITFIFVIILQKTWLEDYKSELDRTLETHKAKLSGYTLVTKLQYELEFEIYTELFGSLMEMLYSARGIIKFREDRGDFYLDKYFDDSNKFSEKLQKYYPFYSKKIYSICREIFFEGQEIKKEYEKYKSTGNFDEDTCNEKFSHMSDLKEVVSELIRKRIENMKIVE